ncbi:MAG: response regulator [Candidatus Pacebacteria bacterium]|nr:response regulator [Candidatus Paceibacterota bacterium]NUQ57349.1 response regulator [Candidatus Paceibacter sp.]
MKLLIVEDDPFLMSVLAEKLKEGGFEIEAAADGENGLEKIRAGNYDLVLLDMVLPKVDGFKVLETMKNDEKMKSVPVIVLSNLYDKNNISKATLMGTKDYIVKAYNTPEDIVAKVKKFLSGQTKK